MPTIKNLGAIALGTAAAIALASPGAAQIRAERMQPSSTGPTTFQSEEIPGQETMTCQRYLNIVYTQRGIAFFCGRGGNAPGRIMAIDEAKFPGGNAAVIQLLMQAREKYPAASGERLQVRYRAPSAKARTICDLAHMPDTVECGEVVSLLF
ncbi:MAG: hypothetical protein AAGK02_11825 [Pseudomonadota bacterium]